MQIPDVTPDLPSRPWRLLLAALARVPQAPLSRSLGRLADVPIPRPVRRPVLGAFARTLGIDVSEAERPLHEYSSLNDFFVRRLRAGAREWPDDPGAVTSPVDGIVGRFGRVEDGRLIQAKGRMYAAAELLGDADEAARFEGGSFVTIYLSPRHYHRIHAPIGGTIPLARHIPGLLHPVNEPGVLHISNLFSANERLFCYIDGAAGRVAVVAVGAYNVGRISAAFDAEWNAPAGGGGSWVTNRRGVREATHIYEPAVGIGRGDELMAFHLGSTVVMLIESGLPALREDLRAGREVRLGESVSV
jgi:phosphatidylserine decarboxylase